jgi:phosphate-selective porin OprO/OprP
MEYSSSFSAFDPFRRVGAASWFVTEDQRSFINYSVYGTGATFYNGTNPNNGATVYNSLGVDNRNATTLGNHGVSFAARGTHLLYWDEASNGRYFWAVGAGYNYSEIGGSGSTGPDARTYQAQTIPEFFVGDPTSGGTTAGGTPNTLNTGRFLANNFSIYHLETCGSYGPAHFQSEYIATVVSQLNGPPVFLNGAYVQGGYFLTGENVGYNKNMGAIDYQVKPYSNFFGLGRNSRMCGWGAWEVASRLSFLSLNGDILQQNQVALPGSAAVAPNQAGNPNPFTVIPGGGGINQGQMVNMTVGINWWWNPFTRLTFNYIYTDVHSSNGGNNTVTVAGAAPYINYGVNTMHIFAGRFQFEF